jgi:hypothetical protein
MFSTSSKLAQRTLLSQKATPQQIILNDVFSLRTLRTSTLVDISVRNKISWNDNNPYNKRWQYKWKHSYYTYPKDGYEHDHVKKPEDTKLATPLFHAWIQDVRLRYLPGLNMWWERRHRVYDNFQLYTLPAISLGFFMLSDVTFGFKLLSVLPWFLFYTRLRDRTLDPDLKETYLRDMLYKNAEISKYFQEETIHVLDYDCEYDKTIDYEKFPEYNNSSWRFFNTDTSMTTGHFKFGDLESGATMTLKFKTMPAPGRFRYQVGEPFYFYDLRADILHNGVYQEVVLVDEQECLKRIRPFLFLV